jgi:hypothetical protein
MNVKNHQGRDDAGGQRGSAPYAPPKLTIHGDLRVITAAKNGNKLDGLGVPKTLKATIGVP